jgi:hypothetical protein
MANTPSVNTVPQLIEDIVWRSDRTFFEQQPRRQFRIRPAWECEIEDFRRHNNLPEDYSKGLCWWIVIRQFRPGIRARYPFLAPHLLPPETTEEDARDIWECLISPEFNEAGEQIGKAYDRWEGAS